MIYCVGQRSTNLSNGMDDADIVFKHTEADTMLISAYAKIRASDLRHWTLESPMCMFKQYLLHIK